MERSGGHVFALQGKNRPERVEPKWSESRGDNPKWSRSLDSENLFLAYYPVPRNRRFGTFFQSGCWNQSMTKQYYSSNRKFVTHSNSCAKFKELKMKPSKKLKNARWTFWFCTPRSVLDNCIEAFCWNTPSTREFGDWFYFRNYISQKLLFLRKFLIQMAILKSEQSDTRESSKIIFVLVCPTPR